MLVGLIVLLNLLSLGFIASDNMSLAFVLVSSTIAILLVARICFVRYSAWRDYVKKPVVPATPAVAPPAPVEAPKQEEAKAAPEPAPKPARKPRKAKTVVPSADAPAAVPPAPKRRRKKSESKD